MEIFISAYYINTSGQTNEKINKDVSQEMIVFFVIENLIAFLFLYIWKQ